jgi:hypothetical protein
MHRAGCNHTSHILALQYGKAMRIVPFQYVKGILVNFVPAWQVACVKNMHRLLHWFGFTDGHRFKLHGGVERHKV